MTAKTAALAATMFSLGLVVGVGGEQLLTRDPVNIGALWEATQQHYTYPAMHRPTEGKSIPEPVSRQWLSTPAEHAKWFCSGPHFDSSCGPANGGNLHCQHFSVAADDRQQTSENVETSYADDGRIAYCNFG